MSNNPFLVFDAYGTLLELDSFYARLRDGFAAYGVAIPSDAIRTAAHIEMVHYMAGAHTATDRTSWLALRRDCAAILVGALQELGHAVPLTPEQSLQVLGDSVAFRAFEESVNVLDELEDRGVAMAVASNWDYQLAFILEEHNLAACFHFALPSALMGYEKPSLKFFEAVRERVFALRPDTDTIYYIGDHYEKDVVPARAAGFEPLWLVRDQRDLASGNIHSSSCQVTRLRTLNDLLKLFP